MTSSGEWGPDMTSAVRHASDTFLQLQWRRLGLAQAPNDALTPSQWNERFYAALLKITGDLEYLPALWQLCTAVLQMIEQPSIPATEFYLSWHSLANGNHALYKSVESDAGSASPNLDWSAVPRTVLELVMLGELSRAGALASQAAYLARNAQAFSAEEETILTDIFGLYRDPFRSLADFGQWRERASQLMFDARHVLDDNGGAEETPYYLVKQLAFDMLTLAVGTRGYMTSLVKRLDHDAVWYVGGIAAVVEPFTGLPQLAAAFNDFSEEEHSSSRAWARRVISSVLHVQSLADFVAVAHDVAGDAPRGSSRIELAAYLFGVHLADIAAPPFVEVGPRGQLVATRNLLVSRFVSFLMTCTLTLWRIGGLYLAFSPVANPIGLAGLLRDAAKTAEEGTISPRSVLEVQVFLREFCFPGSPFQTLMRQALRVRVGASSTPMSTLDALLANFDRTIHRAATDVADDHARGLLASGRVAAAVATWIDATLYGHASRALLDRLRKWSASLAPHCPPCYDRALIDIGAAFRARLLSLPSDGLQLQKIFQLCDVLLDVVPCSTAEGRSFATVEQREHASQRAMTGSRIAAELELPCAAFFLASVSALCCPLAARNATLPELHAAVATAAIRCPAHKREPDHTVSQKHAVRLLHSLAAASDFLALDREAEGIQV